ncbi:MAG: hypothetical protein ACK4TA_14210 [Saprospiraceae bacterium]
MLIGVLVPIVGAAYVWKPITPTKIWTLPTPSVSADSTTVRVLTKNEQVLQYVVQQGKKLAPSYKKVVCTDYIIRVISNFYKLTAKERHDIQILTNKELKPLIKANAPVIKGVYTALIKSGKGVAVKRSEVKPGDFVQFWFVWRSGSYGHCGVVKSIGKNTLTLYSSRPASDGFSVHTYPFPHKAYFVRLK